MECDKGLATIQNGVGKLNVIEHKFQTKTIDSDEMAQTLICLDPFNKKTRI